MTPRRAILTGLARSLDFSTPANRTEYWWFLPAGLALPVLAFLIVRTFWPDTHALMQMGIALGALVPQMAVTCRRLKDSGKGRCGFDIPFQALISTCVVGWMVWALNNFFFSAIAAGADGPTGFGLFIFWCLGSLLLLPLLMQQLLIGGIHGSALFSHMTMPTKPGPNPKEVPQ
jgi:uncharacterized membrane protein YhaH (DUF805 family)